MARKSFVGKSFLEAIFTLPLVLPPVSVGYLLLVIFGSNGWGGGWLEKTLGIRVSFSFWAAVIASMVVAFPLILRSIRSSIEMVDRGLEDAAQLLGKSKWKTLFSITFPLALPGIISGWVLAFARSLGEFGATITFAGNITGETRTLPIAIYTLMQSPGKESSTWRLVIFSIIISLIAMVASEWMLKRMKHDRD